MRAHWRRWLATGTGVLAVLFCCVLIAAPPAGGGGPDKPGQLEVNLVSEPMAVPAGQGTWFSWVTNDARQGEAQHGYELRVAAGPAALASGKAGWDTGTVTSASPGAAYTGSALASGTRYWWTVRTLDAQGRVSQWAAPAQFGTALGAAWDVAPIWARHPPGGKNSGWAFLRGTVSIANKPVIAATVYATAMSTEPARQYVFRLSLNGTVLGVGPVRPPDPATGTEYSAWDVTGALRAGANAFGALAYTASGRRFELELVVQYVGMASARCGGPGRTGRAWTAAPPTPRRAASAPSTTPRRQNLDAERYPFGFDTPGYHAAAAAGWSPAVVAAPVSGLTPDPAANLRLTAHKPVKVTRLGTGRYLLDFGVTQVGGLRLTLDGTAGEKVRILSGEVLSGPGRVQYKLSTGDVYADTWTLRGGRQTLRYWGYRVFRYVSVAGAPQPLTTANTAALALAYPDQPARSAMTTSSAPLNQVWQFSKNTIEALNLDLYLDSPTRERSGNYTGDDYIHQQAQAAVDGDSALAAYSLDFALTYMALGESTSPPLIAEFEELAPVAALAQWWQTGDPAVLAPAYQELQEMLPTGYLAPDGLVDLPVNPFGGARPVAGYPEELIDWPASERDGFVFAPQNTVVNAFGYACYAAMAKIASLLGDQAGARADAAVAARIRAVMQAKLYDSGDRRVPRRRRRHARGRAVERLRGGPGRGQPGPGQDGRRRHRPPRDGVQRVLCRLPARGALRRRPAPGGPAPHVLRRDRQLAAHDRPGRRLHHGGVDPRAQAQPHLLARVGRVPGVHHPGVPVRGAGPYPGLGHGADPPPAGQPHQRLGRGAHVARRGQRVVHQRRRPVRGGDRRAGDRDRGGGTAGGARRPARLGRRHPRDGAPPPGREHRGGGHPSGGRRRRPGGGPGQLRLASRLNQPLTAAGGPARAVDTGRRERPARYCRRRHRTPSAMRRTGRPASPPWRHMSVQDATPRSSKLLPCRCCGRSLAAMSSSRAASDEAASWPPEFDRGSIRWPRVSGDSGRGMACGERATR